MRRAEFGSISSGTMRASDLIPTFAAELGSLLCIQPRSFPRRELRQLIREADQIKDYDTGRADDVLGALFDALGEFAPPYAYFGARPGDGADYGFWLPDDFGADFDGLKVDDLSEIPSDYSGEVLHVNDHGNVTLYASRKGKLKEVWSLV